MFESGCVNCIQPLYVEISRWEKIIRFLGPIGMYILIGAIISFFIILGFYLVYKHKKDKHPRKHAFKRSWLWWVIIFFIPFIAVLGTLSIINYLHI